MKLILIATLLVGHSCAARNDNLSQVTNVETRTEKTFPQEKPYKFVSNVEKLPDVKMKGLLSSGNKYCSVAEAFAKRMNEKYTSTSMPGLEFPKKFGHQC